MKNLITLAIIFIGFGSTVFGQSNGEIYSAKVAGRMKDSLSMTQEQKIQIYNINLQIHSQKSNVWQQYNGVDSLIKIKLQEIENTRDSLYQPILNGMQFQLFVQKKKTLLNN